MLNLFPMLRSDDDLDLFEDVFSVPMFGSEQLMRTDICEQDGRYVMKMDLPGYRKEDIQIVLKDGSLTISAGRNSSNEEKDEKGSVIRQERFSGTCSRTFYVGKNVKETDIHASFGNGTLTLDVPAEKEELPEKKYIDIL